LAPRQRRAPAAHRIESAHSARRCRPLEVFLRNGDGRPIFFESAGNLYLAGTDEDTVAGEQLCRPLETALVDERTVRAAEVFDVRPRAGDDDTCVPAGHHGLVHHDVASVTAPDERFAVFELKLPVSEAQPVATD
jgi:hypothetical protein